MTERSIDELGPVDYLIVEFPAGAQNFTGEGPTNSSRLHDAGTIRIMDILILQKAEDGPSRRWSCPTPRARRAATLEAELAQTLAEEDVAHLAAAMEPGQRRRRTGLREPVGRAVRLGHAPRGRPADRQRPDPDPGHHRRHRSRRRSSKQ